MTVIEDWDVWRRKHRQEGDAENERIPKAQRASEGLSSTQLLEDWTETGEPNRPRRSNHGFKILRQMRRSMSRAMRNALWPRISSDATFRRKRFRFRTRHEEADRFKDLEKRSKDRVNMSIDVRRNPSDLSYLDMNKLANLADKARDKQNEAALSRDATGIQTAARCRGAHGLTYRGREEATSGGEGEHQGSIKLA